MSSGLRNAVWLYLIQGVKVLLPLVSVPYVTRVLGPAAYGQFASALAVTSYFLVVVSFGFDITGPRDVAVAKTPEDRLRDFTEIAVSKLGLGVLACLGLLIFVWSGVVADQVRPLVGIMALTLIASAIQTNWFFQGIQQSGYILISNLVGQLLLLVSIFLFVKGPEDVVLYVFLYSGSAVLAAAPLAVLAVSQFRGLRFRVTFVAIWRRLRGAFSIFVTSFLSTFLSGYAVLYMVIVGIGDASVGEFAAMYKLAALVLAAYVPLGAAWLPHSSRAFSVGFRRGVRASARFGFVVFIGVSVVSATLCVFGRTWIQLVFGSAYVGGRATLCLLGVWAVVGVLNNVVGVQMLVVGGRDRQYAASFILGAVVMVTVTPLCVGWGQGLGAALAMLVAESVLLIANLAMTWRSWLVEEASYVGT